MYLPGHASADDQAESSSVSEELFHTDRTVGYDEGSTSVSAEMLSGDGNRSNIVVDRREGRILIHAVEKPRRR